MNIKQLNEFCKERAKIISVRNGRLNGFKGE